MKRLLVVLLYICLIGIFIYPIPTLACGCPTSSLEVSPQVVAPGAPIKFTFPWDRANYIEDNTNGGLQQEAGHVDSANGGSIHFQNGSNNWYVFHAGQKCGTYTWNHQSGGSCGTCYTSIQFTVCGLESPTHAPTATPFLTATPEPTEYIPPTEIPLPTNPPAQYISPTPILIIPTAMEQQNDNFFPTRAPFNQPSPISPFSYLNIPSFDLMGEVNNIAMKTIGIGRTFIGIVDRFLRETAF